MSREVPEGWRLARLNELSKLTAGGTPARGRPDYYDGDIPWLKSGEINQGRIRATEEKITEKGLSESSAKLIPAGTPVVAMYGATAGVVGFLEIAAAINQAVLAVQPVRELLDADFCLHMLSCQAVNLLKLTQGSGQPNLSKTLIENLEVSLPPIHEQRHIAEILSSVDGAIAATRAVIEQTRKVKQGVLERLLTKGIGHTRFKQTEIGGIPEGWETGRIGDFFTLQRGFDITEKQSNAGEYPVVSSSGISYFHSEAMVRGPAVITGRKGKLGQVHFIDNSCWPHDTTLWVKDFKGNEPKFVYWFLRSLNLEKFDAATAVPTLNRNVVHALKCAFPPNAEQLLIADYLDSIEETEHSQTRNLASYGHMKSALMSDLLTGRKRVTNALLLAAE